MPKKKAASAANLLVEIGTEELPPKALNTLGRTFGDELVGALQDAGLFAKPAQWHWFATPRRLAVWVAAVARRQPDRDIERRGPAIAAAFDKTGKPSKAALGFAGSCGVDVDKLERVLTEKGEWLVYRHRERGLRAADIIPGCIDQAVKRLPIPKRMRWGDLDAEFVRPVHWLLVLHGVSVIKTELLGVVAGRTTRGHRFHAPAPIKLKHPDDYSNVLSKQGKVVADFATRRQQIRMQVEAAAKKVKGRALIEEALLDEVTGLVEWPQALAGNFDRDFLSVPDEALISSMQDHQKYFPVIDGKGHLLPHFITVSNIKSKTPARVRQGNERVLRARLSDARFFWDSDRKRGLDTRVKQLSTVVFHNKLGTVADKTVRIMDLSEQIAKKCNIDVRQSRRAAELCKADLVSDMVGEFPELQGTMGRYYAIHDGEDAEVAQAIQEHYMPRFSGDSVPASGPGSVVALADKLDTVVGIFAAGEPPSGDKDPFGLRRAALGVLRIIIEGGFALDLRDVIDHACSTLQKSTIEVKAGTAQVVFEFISERLTAYFSAQEYRSEEIAAVASRSPGQPLDFESRLKAVAAFRKLPESTSLAAANKRIGNILRRATEAIPSEVDASCFQEQAERDLADIFIRLNKQAKARFEQREYKTGLVELAKLRRPVDRFFDEVMVMADDPRVRSNRLALLMQIHELFLQVADISKLQAMSGE